MSDAPQASDLLARAVAHLGGKERPGQVEMVDAVDRALDTGEHLLIQAGTGTGKSLGYLVPTITHAVTEQKRVVVSTATLALQRQVLTRDLPLVAEAVAPALPRPPQIALLKGWHNYVCVHKTAGGYPDEDPGLFDLVAADGAAEHPPAAAARPDGLGAQVRRLREWTETTATGDRDDLDPGVSDRAWRQVSVTALECLGARCPMLDECFPEQARERARQADVVVTNHAMLGIAASGSSGVLPEHEVLVVDEAHELPDRVTAQATMELSPTGIEIAARTARRNGGVTTGDLEVAGRDLAAAVSEVPDGRLDGGLPDGLGLAVAAVRNAARGLLSELRPKAGERPGSGEGADPGLKVAAAAVLALLEIADRMTGDAARDGRDVLWCSRGRAGEDVPRLFIAPLVVSGLVRTNLVEGRTAILTSATLTLGGRFEPVARSVGLEGPAGDAPTDGTDGGPGAGATSAGGAPSERWRGLDVGSPFDHARLGILYVARRLPPPGRGGIGQEQLDELVSLVEASGGGALGLFSSRRAAEEAAEEVRRRLTLPVLCQGEDQLPSLVRRFAEDDTASLFGSLSLWQGVDVPGRTNRLVIIDRIPFPRPDDPVRSARSDAVARSGGNGFMTVAASHAALLLAQGAGRLVRAEDDRGVVAVLDPRLATARYGAFLLKTLPDFWRTSDGDAVRAALRRLTAAVHP